ISNLPVCPRYHRARAVSFSSARGDRRRGHAPKDRIVRATCCNGACLRINTIQLSDELPCCARTLVQCRVHEHDFQTTVHKATICRESPTSLVARIDRGGEVAQQQFAHRKLTQNRRRVLQVCVCGQCSVRGDIRLR